MRGLRAVMIAKLMLAVALLLQGCSPRRACNIDDIYSLIQVDGRTGLTKHELEKAGVKLCARHLRKEETYANDACVEPNQVFTEGILPTPANGDSNALLLVRCPSTAYPKGKELQRVTCSDDYMGEAQDGTVLKALHLRFDNYERASNCLLSFNTTLDGDDNTTLDRDQTETMPEEIMTQDNHSTGDPRIPHPKKRGTPASMVSKVVRRGDDISWTPKGVSFAEPEVIVATTSAADQEDAAQSAHERAPALKREAGIRLTKTDVSIHAKGSVHVRHDRRKQDSSHPAVSHHQERRHHSSLEPLSTELAVDHGETSVADSFHTPDLVQMMILPVEP